MKIDPKRAVSGDFSQALPLWGSPEAWREANQTMNHLIHLHRPELGRAKGFAHGILDQLMPVFSRLDDVCAVTCPWCPDPCCLKAKVWVDFKDLLFLHLTDQTIPSVQLTQNPDNRCYYLGHKGCTLPRVIRPWICTRYLCPCQMANLRKRPGSAQELFDQAFQAVKAGRNKMEAEFIRIVS